MLGVVGVIFGGVLSAGCVMDPGGALMPRLDIAEEPLTGRPGDGSCEFEDTMDVGRRSSEMAWAIRRRLPNWGMSSSLSRFASSSSRRSPVISCSGVSGVMVSELTCEPLTHCPVKTFDLGPVNNIIDGPYVRRFVGIFGLAKGRCRREG